MGKTPVNRALGELRGKIDDYVFRNLEGETVVARRPRPLKVPPTASQLAVQERFRQAGKYAKAVLRDPARKQPYLDFAEESGVSNRRLFGVIARDYLQPPEILNIDTTYYKRVVGGEIHVMAKDDVLVTGVTLKLTRHADGSLIEEGPATYYGPYWRYVATAVAPPAGELIDIEVIATDLAKNRTIERMGLMT